VKEWRSGGVKQGVETGPRESLQPRPCEEEPADMADIRAQMGGCGKEGKWAWGEGCIGEYISRGRGGGGVDGGGHGSSGPFRPGNLMKPLPMEEKEKQKNFLYKY
jgi:hypothetical protein